MGERSQEDLAQVFAGIARELQAEKGAEHTLHRVTVAAVETVAGCDHAGITIVRRGKVETLAASDDVPRAADGIQGEEGEGPCLEAIKERSTYLIDDLTREERWPAFSRRAAEEIGLRSMLALRLFVDGDTIGALDLYSRAIDAFDEHARAVCSILAAHAAVAITTARERDRAHGLEGALESNREIGMAMGILMSQGRRTSDEAFDLLRNASQHLNVKLRDVAARVVDTGELPDR